MVPGGAMRHPDVVPGDCPRCCEVFAALAARQGTSDVAPTVPELCTRVGLADRTVRLHLSYLVARGCLLPDRRTPVPGAEVSARRSLPPVFTPLMWAENANVPAREGRACRTCRRILRELAERSRGTWAGQVGMNELAGLLGLSEHTVRMHARSGHRGETGPGHSLAGAGLVEFTPSPVARLVGSRENGRPQFARLPDHYALQPHGGRDE